MRMSEIFRLNPLLSLALYAVGLLCQPDVIAASPPPADSVHFCALFDHEQSLRENPLPAGKLATGLNVGPPRTVRSFYFLPNDRPFRQEVVDSLKTAIKQIQTFFTQQMRAHGYGEMTFHYEADVHGDPLVHRVDGEHGDSYYLRGSWSRVLREIHEVYDRNRNVHLIVIDNSTDALHSESGDPEAFGLGTGGKSEGRALVTGGFRVFTVAHELAHAFGMLWHDYRDDSYILASGGGLHRLSACSADFLAASPFFNPDITLEGLSDPTIERVSPTGRYPAGSTSVSVQLKVTDLDGLGQVILLTSARGKIGGGSEVKACRRLNGEKDTVVDFEYDGVIPSSIHSTLSNPPNHQLTIVVIDADGNSGLASFNIAESTPYYLATLEGHTDYIPTLAISPDGATLATGSWDSTIKLWDTKTREEIATLNEYREKIKSLTFSPDGTVLASGAFDGGIALWNVATGELKDTLEGHESWATSLAFFPDGATLVSGSWYDNDIRLWDMPTGELTGTLEGHADGINDLVFSPTGDVLASGSKDGTIRIWDVAARTEIFSLLHNEGRTVNSLAWSLDGSTLAASMPDPGLIALWDVATRRNLATLVKAHSDFINELTISPDGASLATAGADGAVILRNILTGNVDHVFPMTGAAVSLVYWPDGTVLATTSTVDKIELWDTSEWLRPRPFRLAKISGGGQQSTPGIELPRPFVVEVRDQYDNPLPDVAVTFTVTEGGGMLGGKFTLVRAKTDASGTVSVFLTLGPSPGVNAVEVSMGERVLTTFQADGVGTSVTVGADDFSTWHLLHGAIARLGKGSIGESDRALALSPDGKYLSVASEIGVWLYDAASSRVLALLPSASPVYSVSFSPKGTMLASALFSGTIELWDAEAGTRIAVLEGHRDAVRSVSFSPDGATLASGGFDNTVRLWDVSARREIATLTGHSHSVFSVAFSPDRGTLASASYDRTVRLWDVAGRSEIATLEGHRRIVNSVEFSPDGTILASGSGDGTVRLWNVSAGNEISTTLVGRGLGVSSVTFSPDGTVMAFGSKDGTVSLWDVAAGDEIATVEGHGWNSSTSVAFSPDGAKVVSSGSMGGEILVRDIETRSTVRLSRHRTITSSAFSSDGANLVTGTRDGTILWWDVSVPAVVAATEGHRSEVSSLVISPGGTAMASLSGDAVKLWDVSARSEIASLEVLNATTMSISPDGATLAFGKWDGTVTLWDVSTREQFGVLEGHTDAVWSLSFSSDGATLASGSWDGTVRLWDVSTQREIGTLKRHTDRVMSVAFSPDGVTLATGSYDRTARLWDTSTRKEIASLAHARDVLSVAFSPDGTVLAAVTPHKIRLWDVVARDEIATLTGHTAWIHSVLFSPDGTMLASGSNDGTLLIWDTQRVQSLPKNLKGLSGIEQTGPAGTLLAQPFVVTLNDQKGNPYAGAIVSFAVSAGGGTLSATTDTTDANGRAATTLTLGSQPGTNTVVATVAGLEPVVFTAIARANPDFDFDGEVGFSDFVQFAAKFGLSHEDDGYDPRYDLDGNGSVGFSDFLILAGAFGQDA